MAAGRQKQASQWTGQVKALSDRAWNEFFKVVAEQTGPEDTCVRIWYDKSTRVVSFYLKKRLAEPEGGAFGRSLRSIADLTVGFCKPWAEDGHEVAGPLAATCKAKPLTTGIHIICECAAQDCERNGGKAYVISWNSGEWHSSDFLTAERMTIIYDEQVSSPFAHAHCASTS